MSAEYDLNHRSDSPIYDDQRQGEIEYTKEELFEQYASNNELPDVVIDYVLELCDSLSQYHKVRTDIRRELGEQQRLNNELEKEFNKDASFKNFTDLNDCKTKLILLTELYNKIRNI